MNLTTFSDYALRILIFLAVSDAPRVSARAVAGGYGISVHHVAKAAKWLAREGLVTARRGRGGGLRLARPADEITVGEVLRRSERGARPVACMREGGSCPIDGACGLAPALDEAREAFFAVLDRHSLADAAARRAGIARLLRLAA